MWVKIEDLTAIDVKPRVTANKVEDLFARKRFFL